MDGSYVYGLHALLNAGVFFRQFRNNYVSHLIYRFRKKAEGIQPCSRTRKHNIAAIELP